MRDNSKFLRGLRAFGIALTDQQLMQFEEYYDLLMQWNAVMNLTAITEYEEVIEKHFLDSLSLVQIKKPLAKKKLLDLGTGAGFPGIPLKIAFPEMEVLLLDSLKKRIHFLEEVIDKLSLTKIRAIHARAEELARKEEYREQYDYCVSRAVARLASLAECSLPFVKKGGYFIPYKSLKAEEEYKEAGYAIEKLGGKIESVTSFSLSESESYRSLILIRKEKMTPKEYPRGTGKVMKEPLRGNIMDHL